MSVENGKHIADNNGHLNRRKAVKGFAEFCCSPVKNKDTWKESAEDFKVKNTNLEYTYPLKLLVPGFASSVPCCQWLYVITFGGGLVEGDNVSLDVKVGEHCTVVVTTQASTKVYNSEESLVTQQGLRGLVADGGLLAVLPDPVVCFKNAIYSQKQDFELTSDGSVVILDWFTAGRVALGEVWDMISYKSHNRVFVDGKQVYGDSIFLSNENSFLSLKESMFGVMVTEALEILMIKLVLLVNTLSYHQLTVCSSFRCWEPVFLLVHILKKSRKKLRRESLFSQNAMI